MRLVTEVSRLHSISLDERRVAGFVPNVDPYRAVNRFQVTLEMPAKKAPMLLSSRVGSVFDALASKNAVQTSLTYDTTRRAVLERRALASAFIDARKQAAGIAESMPGRPIAVVAQIVADRGLGIVSEDAEIGFKQPFFLAIRKGIVVMFKFVRPKDLVASIIKKIA